MIRGSELEGGLLLGPSARPPLVAEDGSRRPQRLMPSGPPLGLSVSAYVLLELVGRRVGLLTGAVVWLRERAVANFFRECCHLCRKLFMCAMQDSMSDRVMELRLT